MIPQNKAEDRVVYRVLKVIAIVIALAWVVHCAANVCHDDVAQGCHPPEE